MTFGKEIGTSHRQAVRASSAPGGKAPPVGVGTGTPSERTVQSFGAVTRVSVRKGSRAVEGVHHAVR